MTNTPGDEQPPQEPRNEPAPEQPGYWEQQGRQTPPGNSQAPGYPPQGYAPMAPQQYAPDHPRATTSLVLGILGVVLCQVLAPFAWVIGKRTVDEIDASGGRMGGRGSAQAGYILGIVGTVLLGLGVVYLLIMLVIMGGALMSSLSSTTG
jgi:hypothetical protein